MFYTLFNPDISICTLYWLIVTEGYCDTYWKESGQYLMIMLIILSNDVHKNPGPFQNSYFTFMNWNCNSIAKDDFYRIRLLEAENAIFKYDLISLCETSLNDSVEFPDEFLGNEYTFISANKTDNTRHGGVGLFYKNSLPIKIRNDLSFDESIVVELTINRKNIFFTVLYRSPAFNHNSPEFANFKTNISNLYTNIKREQPYITFFTGDFNAHSQIWYHNGDTNSEGNALENLLSSL